MWDNATITMLLEGVRDTLYMTLASTFFGYVLGLPLGVILAVTDKDGIKPNAFIYKILDIIVNILRSIPFLILLILVIPITRAIVGKTYGSTATVVPLVIAAAPFIARMVESSLKEVNGGVIEAAQSMGAGNFHYNMESSFGRGENIPFGGSHHSPWHNSGIFRNGRCSRRRWLR